MSLTLLFWLLFLFWVLLGATHWSMNQNPPLPWQWWVPFVLLSALLFVLGWGIFGFPIKG